ncbi:MAG: sugar phosphate nucleotidyltransferase [Rhodospirillales bacterium]|nr:sugar phosphate nucleotidyltransferase [Rhodospirillales bacterium]MCW8952817.1 sugar phosphate nucleotidyltransferase [Rhodospirillales bacterium]MCW9003090.1 sugar phosphate nucleotidyltransferase [Rhodospirillales bacterium]
MSGIPSQFVFLVGGRGTRLGALTRDTPKPLLGVAGRPFVETLFEWASRNGAAEIVLLCGHMADRFIDRYDGRAVHGVSIRCFKEEGEGGTAGGLLSAGGALAETFILANGDSLFDCDLVALGNVAAPDNWLGKIALRHIEDTGRAGVVDLFGNRIDGFRERGVQGEPGTINGGVYILKRGILDCIGAPPCSMERDVFPALAKDGLLYGTVLNGFFIDIGVPADYERAQTAIPEHFRVNQ